jgi:glycosyltransferase involved in cell wall biosynthesis
VSVTDSTAAESDVKQPLKKDAPSIRVGVVATNQDRKDWGLVAAIARGLLDIRNDISWWWHVDAEIRSWSLPALIADFNLTNVEITTEQFTDAQMAALYRTCALTLAPGLGEGYGYCIFESLACGVPVLHGNYAGGASLMRTCKLDNWLVPPTTFRLEGQHNCLRPVYDPEAWVAAIQDKLSMALPLLHIEQQVEHLDWHALGPRWRRWMRDGIGL